MNKVAIIDGFAEGKWNTKIFRKALRQNNFEVTDIVEEADIIVAHSAGCLYLPKIDAKQLIILIGPPFWPGKSLIISMTQKIYTDFIYRKREKQLAYWFVKNLWCFGYLFGDVIRALHIMLYARRHDFHERLPNKKIILIRNDDDAWCTPNLQSIPFQNKDVTFYTLPGDHDDCWIHPQPYIDIINQNL